MQYLQFSVNLRTWWLVRSQSKPGPPALQAELILPGSKGEGGARLYFAYVFCPLPYAGLKNRGLASSMGQFVGEWKRLGAERTVAHVPGEFFRQAWQVTSHITHLIAPLPPFLPPPPYLRPGYHTHFFSALMINAKKKINLICFLTLIGRCIQSHPSFMSPVWSRSIYLQYVSLAFSFISPVWSRSIYLQLVDLAFFARPFRQLIFLWIGVIVSLFTLKEGLIC